ncbi:oligoendopeptidase F [Anaerococcus sp. AGMB00486]|uniref:Oligopeptidase F n=2 Tax=Anaerococcus TaxID=165779 RepID=A0ABX2N8W3_9FIRM|nr:MULTISPECIES: oligoendopeptidase F [Anaerococcus]MSS77424.1 oligoendopeptidase F [Anaerococcus porci]NVF11083.1 oligoendopeptidase F [Anaerococcus faecalis]
MKKRSEVDVKETWKLEDIFENDKAFYDELENTLKLSEDFKEEFKEIDSSEKLKRALKSLSDIVARLHRLGSFAGISTEVDANDPHPQKRYAKFGTISSDIGSNLTFFDGLLTKIDEDIVNKTRKENPDYDYYLKKILDKKDHILDDSAEEVLSKLAPTFDAPYGEYSSMRYGDIKVDPIEVDGKKINLNHNNFEEYFEADKNTEVRRKAFRNYHDALRRYERGNGAIYNTQVQNEKIVSKLRGFDSVIDMLLSYQDIPREIYDNHIDTIMAKLPKYMRKYANIIKKVYKLDEMTYADLKLSIDSGFSKEIEIEEARDYIIDGLKVLGDDYVEMLKRAFSERWIDYAENEGKRTGAFCDTPYGVHSYIMTTYNKDMSQVMTLAHELGHAGHFENANKNQDALNTNVSMYFVESPSTANEITMERYLLKNAKDDRQKLWVLDTMISKTYYHNFVTHFLEAAFQREVYERVDKGESLSSDDLNQIFREKLEEFWGSDVKLVDGSELTWMRQPHYYMGLYPYTYSAGLTIGTQVSEKLIHGDKEDIKRWREVLNLGSTLSPMDLAKKAGVDMTNTKALEDTIDFIGEIIDKIDELCQKIGLYE